MQALLDTRLFTLNGHEVTLSQVVVAPLLVVIGLFLLQWAIKKIALRLESRKVNADAIHLFRRIFLIIGIIILVITALDILNVPLTAFAFVSGAVAIGFGFGAQNIINNFISGWILMWERPIKIGDFLEVGDAKGTVESINTRSTRIRRTDGVHMLIPNSYLLENTVVNWTLVDRLTRGIVRVGVQYGSPVQKVTECLQQAMAGNSSVLEHPAPCVIFEDFGDNALIFDAYFWINTSAEKGVRDVKSELRYSFESLLNENAIVIAYPQRDVHLDGVLKLQDERER